MWGSGIDRSSALHLTSWGIAREWFIVGRENTSRPINPNPAVFILSDFSVQLENCFTYLLCCYATRLSFISWCTLHIFTNQENFEVLEYIVTVPLNIIATGNCPPVRLQLWNWYICTTWRLKIQVFRDMKSCGMYIQSGARNVIPFYHPIKILTS